MSEPLCIEGFYATRMLARRAARFALFLAMIAAAIVLGTAVAVLAVLDFVGVVTWGMQ